MASGAAGIPAGATAMGMALVPAGYMAQEQAARSGGSPGRSRRQRSGDTGQPPLHWIPPGTPETHPTEHGLAEVINDHTEKLKLIVAAVSAMTVKVEGHEMKVNMLGSNDDDLKSRLKQMETQLVDNDANLKENLKQFEAQTTVTRDAMQRLEAIAVQLQDFQPANFEAKVNESLGQIADRIGQIDKAHQAKGEELFSNFQQGMMAISGRVQQLEQGMGQSQATFASAGGPAQGQAAPMPRSAPMPAQMPHMGVGSFGGFEYQTAGDVRYPKFDKARISAAVYQQIDDPATRRAIFEDKVAVAPNMQYKGSDKVAWLKTTSNYLCSKAFEMSKLLLWAESAQEHAITEQHISALSESGMCMDVHPIRLSRDLWGYLNLAISDLKEKATFNTVTQGNGFEAWRKMKVPVAPRSKARIHAMHREVNNPPPSKKLSEVMADIDAWESSVVEFEMIGGAPMHEQTRIVCALGMLPEDTPASIRLALKDIETMEGLKDVLRSNIQYLSDYTGNRKVGAHIAEDRSGPTPLGAAIPTTEEAPEETPLTVEDLPAFVAEGLSHAQREQLVLAVNAKTRRGFPPGRLRAPGRTRAPTPPRDAKDVKCGNCGASGHTAQQCKKPRIPFREKMPHL